MSNLTCRECGAKDFGINYTEPTKQRMIAGSLCFTCLFWTDKIAIANEPHVARIGGSHYMIGHDDAPAGLRGSYGREYTVRFADGRTVTTHNLWHQGAIPAHFRSRLPDNAVFVARDASKAA